MHGFKIDDEKENSGFMATIYSSCDCNLNKDVTIKSRDENFETSMDSCIVMKRMMI